MRDHFRQSGEESAWKSQLQRDYYTYYRDKLPPPSNLISSFPGFLEPRLERSDSKGGGGIEVIEEDGR